ncbi:MAG: DUF3565 domain-containing protein [Acidimicrobiales bacterium]
MTATGSPSSLAATCQHVRHRPPIQIRAWVTGEAGRTVELGGEAACVMRMLCVDCGAILDGGLHMEGCHSEELR